MIPGSEIVDLSRLQFALTALYHFLFVPLTLGLSLLLAIMETVYVMTGREIWRQLVKYWGLLFGINFVMGVATGLTMEFQFGTNWAYYSHYVGDVFGAPLAIEGLMAFSWKPRLWVYFFRLGKIIQISTHDLHLAVSVGYQFICFMDFNCKRLDAKSSRRKIQFSNHAHGSRRFC